MRLVIVQDNALLARIDNYEGPVPRAGEYVYIPQQGDYGHDDTKPPVNVVSVKTVTYNILARPRTRPAAGLHYVGRSPNEDVVELVV